VRSAGAWRGAEDVGVGGISLRRMLAVFLWPPRGRHSVLMVVGHDSGSCSASGSGSWLRMARVRGPWGVGRLELRRAVISTRRDIHQKSQCGGLGAKADEPFVPLEFRCRPQVATAGDSTLTFARTRC
jgi:hypothetical protein